MVVFHAKIIPHSAYVVWFSRQPLRHCRPRVSDTMAVRQNTVRKSATAVGAASCRAAFWTVLLLPLLGVSEFGRAGGLSRKEHKGPQGRCAVCADCCTMVS